MVVFLHGWGATNPRPYRPWIDHLVKRGNLVVYPVYQDGMLYPIAPMMSNAAAAVRDALARLDRAPVRDERERLAIVGHSLGAAMGASLAASYQAEGLPSARAVMCVQPGKTWSRARRAAIELADLSRIPASTLLLTVAGEDDRIAQDVDARKIFLNATAVPPANKNFITVLSDRHGDPALVADHFSPSGHKVDALDYYGYWKLFDALYSAAFYGTDRRYALGDTPEQRYMGVWSDGVPVKERRVLSGRGVAHALVRAAPRLVPARDFRRGRDESRPGRLRACATGYNRGTGGFRTDHGYTPFRRTWRRNTLSPAVT